MIPVYSAARDFSLPYFLSHRQSTFTNAVTNPDLALLQPYPFEKIRLLLAELPVVDKPRIALSVGEPKHAAPAFVHDALLKALPGLETYPTTRSSDALRESIAQWLTNRFQLTQAVDSLATRHVLPVNGTREALFAIAQCLLDRTQKNRDVLMPNPFYQIYEGATLLAGCNPSFYAIDDHTDDNLSAIPDAAFESAQMFYLCNPGNPTGGVATKEGLMALIERAQRFNVTLVSDECYSEIYRENSGAPVGLLTAAEAVGLDQYQGCLVFHSLSKRSNLPGLRSGFVAGDAQLIDAFATYRTYHGCTMPPPTQAASAAAWADEEHVAANRAAYDAKYAAVLPILQSVMTAQTPAAGFYLWPQLFGDDKEATQRLHSEQNVAVVPGSYLAREMNGFNPGTNRIRMALVAPIDDCIEAAKRMASCLS